MIFFTNCNLLVQNCTVAVFCCQHLLASLHSTFMSTSQTRKRKDCQIYIGYSVFQRSVIYCSFRGPTRQKSTTGKRKGEIKTRRISAQVFLLRKEMKRHTPPENVTRQLQPSHQLAKHCFCCHRVKYFFPCQAHTDIDSVLRRVRAEKIRKSVWLFTKSEKADQRKWWLKGEWRLKCKDEETIAFSQRENDKRLVGNSENRRASGLDSSDLLVHFLGFTKLLIAPARQLCPECSHTYHLLSCTLFSQSFWVGAWFGGENAHREKLSFWILFESNCAALPNRLQNGKEVQVKSLGSRRGVKR